MKGVVLIIRLHMFYYDSYAQSSICFFLSPMKHRACSLFGAELLSEWVSLHKITYPSTHRHDTAENPFELKKKNGVWRSNVRSRAQIPTLAPCPQPLPSKHHSPSTISNSHSAPLSIPSFQLQKLRHPLQTHPHPPLRPLQRWLRRKRPTWRRRRRRRLWRSQFWRRRRWRRQVVLLVMVNKIHKS